MTEDLLPTEENGMEPWSIGFTLVNFQKVAGDKLIPLQQVLGAMDCFQQSMKIILDDKAKNTQRGFYLNPKTELADVNAIFSIAQNYLDEPDVVQYIFKISTMITQRDSFFHLSKDKEKKEEIIAHYVRQVSHFLLFLVKIINNFGDKYLDGILQVQRSVNSSCHHLSQVQFVRNNASVVMLALKAYHDSSKLNQYDSS